MELRQENNYPKAFLATGIIMAVLLALCYLIVIHMPPKEAEGIGGILVNYGTTDEGSGNDISSLEEPSQAEKPNKTQPTKVTPEQSTDKPTPTDNSDQKVVTQNTEDAPVVDANTKKTTTATAAQPTKPVVKQEVNKAALFPGMSKPGAGAGDGTTDKAGNQGSKNGSPNVSNYGPGGSGTGLSLPNWHFVDPPNVKNIHRVEGKVFIDFTIDEHGNVIQASANKKSTASLDLIQSCIDAIKASKFTSSAPASGNAKGQMSFIFRVD